MNDFIVILIILFPFLMVYGAYQFHLFKEGKAFYFNRIKWGTKINRKRYLELDDTLIKRISFYNYLSDSGKAKFINRLCNLLVIKKFVAKNKIVLNEEIKIVACASIVQLTYGLTSYELDNIKGFYIYPSIFYNRFIKNYIRGNSPRRDDFFKLEAFRTWVSNRR